MKKNITKQQILEKIKQDMKEKGFLDKYSGCLSKKR
tara:strand:- start:1986 stop:2093 length:108 start_codon:yes stop_codon:yes gene_type:complete